MNQKIADRIAISFGFIVALIIIVSFLGGLRAAFQ